MTKHKTYRWCWVCEHALTTEEYEARKSRPCGAGCLAHAADLEED